MNQDNLLKETKKEERRIVKILKECGIKDDALKLSKNLISENAFLSVQLRTLRETIINNGVCEEYKNGENQFGRKKSAEVDIYNNLIKHFISINKQLFELLPDKINAKKSGLNDFINSKPD